jgi:carotenoid cleavage dioxygenase-like enzyme
MSKPFPDSFQGNAAPWRLEGEAHDLPVIGTLPPGLSGTFYRNGPNPQFPPRGFYANWYDGDGMVHAFRFEEGRVHYTNKWVRTERFARERDAGEALFGTLFEPRSVAPSVKAASRNTANATIVCHGGKVLATWETGLPHEIDAETLETRGLYNFGGAMPHDMMAHPKIDSVSGEMHVFGRTAPHPEPGNVTYHVVDPAGTVIHTTEIAVPYESMTHDMFMTENFVVLTVFPAVYDHAREAAGGPYVAWEKDRASFLGVLPKGGAGSDINWIEFAGCWGSHTMNAYERDGVLLCDVIRYPRAMLFPDPDGSWPTGLEFPALHRWTVDPAARTVAQRRFDTANGEMPVMDMRFRGRPYRHGYSAGWSGAVRGLDAIHHYNWETGGRRSYVPGEGCLVQEPVFVPTGPTAGEGEGYLLALVYRGAEHRSDLVVLNAQAIDEAPIATVVLPHRIVTGLHGAWRPH